MDALPGACRRLAEDFDRHHADALRDRFTAYAEKAIREAKLRTDWTAPNRDYEEAVRTYTAALFSTDNDAFTEDFARVLQPFIEAGYVNSLSQTLIKLTAPGIPDIYQGAEGFDFSFVDPDNRRLPDFETLSGWLAEGGALARLQAAALKQRIIQIGLGLRMERARLSRKAITCRLPSTGPGVTMSSPLPVCIRRTSPSQSCRD